jgi:hypothetical protein
MLEKEIMCEAYVSPQLDVVYVSVESGYSVSSEFEHSDELFYYDF